MSKCQIVHTMYAVDSSGREAISSDNTGTGVRSFCQTHAMPYDAMTIPSQQHGPLCVLGRIEEATYLALEAIVAAKADDK